MLLQKLKDFTKSVNIASELSKEKLDRIGQCVLLGFREDLNSSQEWLNDAQKIEDLAKLTAKPKSTQSLRNAANVKLPLITKACMEFSSRTYPEIIRDGSIAKYKIVGKDYNNTKKDMGQRVCDYVNYQLLFENTDWEQQLDTLLFRIALLGFMCKKTYYDPIRKKIKAIICDPTELIINADATSLESAPRISHILHWRLNDLIEGKNKKQDGVSVFLEDPVKDLMNLYKDDELNKIIDGIEQCTYLDLDEDGYLEPYIVTVTKTDGKVLRIVPRFAEEDICDEDGKLCYITPIEIYDDYHFFPNPNGKFLSVGFGILLLHLTESCNSILNQLIDSGQLANMKGGYMDARCKMMPSGDSKFRSGEFKEVKVMPGSSLKDGIVPIQYGEPSSVLYQLLGLLMDTARDLTSSSQINNGTQSSQNAKTGATMALQEEGRKTFNAINKRVYRSLSKELKHIFRLNGMYLDPDVYYEASDDKKAVKQTDFNSKHVKIVPVADPNLASDTQRLAEAQFVQSIIQLPGIDPIKATEFILSKTTIPGIMGIMIDPKAPKQPNPDILRLQADMEEAGQKLSLQAKAEQNHEREIIIKAHLADAQIQQMKANAVQLLAKAESEDQKSSLQQLQFQLDALSQHMNLSLELANQQHEKEMQSADQNHQQGMQAADQAHQQDMQQQEAQNNENETSGGVAEQSGNQESPQSNQ